MIEQRLLACLADRANTRGTVLVRIDVLSECARTTQEEVGGALAKLERAGLLTVQSPAPFLVLKLRSWSGRSGNTADSQTPAYSYSKLSSNRLNESYRQDDGLLREILDTLGETDPTTFEGAVRNFSPDVIRKALDRVRRTRSVRKNRTALFRYLLTKLA
jgi:hypothetical protein